MIHDPLLDRICRELTEAGAHTVLLYGSRADGSESEVSDYDVAAFAPVDRVVRDASVMDGHFLDVFTHPDEALSRPTAEFFTAIDALVDRAKRRAAASERSSA
jgi:predicted nucleotidyltransferase